MNCIQHDDRVSVISCRLCGAGLCKECGNNSQYFVDNKPHCEQCNEAFRIDTYRNLKSQRRACTIKLVFYIICLSLGLAYLLGVWYESKAANTKFLTYETLFMLLLIFGIASIGKYFQFLSSRSDLDKAESFYLSQKNPIIWMTMWIASFLIRMLLYGIALPIMILIILVERRELSKDLMKFS